MISTQFKKANIFMDLPQVEDSVSVTMQEVSANLAVNQNEIELEGKIIAPEALEEELLKMLETNPKLTILFSADKNINYERFLEIYVKLEKAGIERILIEHETLAD